MRLRVAQAAGGQDDRLPQLRQRLDLRPPQEEASVSKIRQALEYEHRLGAAENKALKQAVAYNRKLTDVSIKGQVAVRKASLKYERKITDGQFGQLEIVAQEHRQFHEREHLLYENAIDKAASSLFQSLTLLQTDMERFRIEAGKWMTREDSDREHDALGEKTELAIKTLSEKIAATEKVDIRQSGIAEATEKLTNAAERSSENSKTNRRWIIGLTATVIFSTIASVLGLITLIIHLAEATKVVVGS
jgi:hypothetical protein